MNHILAFSFRCADGLHLYLFNSKSKISTFLLIENNKVINKEDCYCPQEDIHIKRVQLDFNTHLNYDKEGNKFTI